MRCKLGSCALGEAPRAAPVAHAAARPLPGRDGRDARTLGALATFDSCRFTPVQTDARGGGHAEPNVEVTRAEGPVPRPKNASTPGTWRTGRLLTRPSASVLGDLSGVSPATSRSRSHSLRSDRFAASPVAKPTPSLTRRSSLSGKRRAPSSSPRTSQSKTRRAGKATAAEPGKAPLQRTQRLH